MSDPQENYVGQGISRVDGRLKVTGTARFSADMPAPARVAHAVILDSTITRGRIASFDLTRAHRVPGVIEIFTHQSGLKLIGPKEDPKTGGKSGNESWMPLQNADVHWNGQHVALVLAETLEAATQAADFIKVKYIEELCNIDLAKPGEDSESPKSFFGQELQSKRGDPDGAIANAGTSAIQVTYETPVEHHNPMELHATLAFWDGDELTVYDATQNVGGTKSVLASTLDVPEEKVKVLSLFLGGGFGCKGFYWPHTSLAAAAARKLHRPVKLVLTRAQMFTLVGHRSRTQQAMTLSAQKNGQLTAIRHASTVQSSRVAKFIEPCGFVTKMLYATPNLDVSHRLVRIDSGTPCPMRAPGEASGSFGLECAMDELAYKLDMDPIDLRLKNYAEKNPEDGLEFSSKHLRECYDKGRDAFGWSKRKSEPRSHADGNWLIGYGMATASYPANRMPASAKATMKSDGTAMVVSAAHDLGTGAYTVMTQISADALGLPIEKVRFELGNSSFPKAPGAGGSQTSASVGHAVQAAAQALRQKIINLAIADAQSPLHGATEDQIRVEHGRLFQKEDSTRGETYVNILQRAGQTSIEAEMHVEANTRKKGPAKPGAPDTSKYAFHSFGAHFVEVRVDRDLGEVRVARMLGVYDVGRVLNTKTARSQAIGGMSWGLGMALMEETIFDRRTGRIMTSNLADYRLPVNADIPPTEVIFLDHPDPQIGALGMRGLGEIPITGMAAAIANAVYHATGRRIRELPITPDKLI